MRKLSDYIQPFKEVLKKLFLKQPFYALEEHFCYTTN
jgi:hypothetical protein